MRGPCVSLELLRWLDAETSSALHVCGRWVFAGAQCVKVDCVHQTSSAVEENIPLKFIPY